MKLPKILYYSVHYDKSIGYAVCIDSETGMGIGEDPDLMGAIVKALSQIELFEGAE